MSFVQRFSAWILQSPERGWVMAGALALPAILMNNEGWLYVIFAGSLCFISIVTVAAMTLYWGPTVGAIAVVFATLPIVIGDRQDLLTTGFNPLDSLQLLAISNLLTWCFAALLENCRRWWIVVSVGTLLVVCMVVLLQGIIPTGIADWWNTHLGTYFVSALKDVGAGNADSENMRLVQANLRETEEAIKPSITVLLTSFIASNALVQVWLGQWLLKHK